MKKQRIVLITVILIGFGLGVVYAKPVEEARKISGEEMLEEIKLDDQNRRLTELARSITNLERRIDRIDERFQRLDNDLKELKRKV
ncbi:MAG: hypothetical protein HY583_00155 [Candidatus Omnitrophica bacterium]|nr:hypothetical protein [Candidatus Omnitrophota bacterium]